MSKIRIGIICPSEIALRRFMPAISKCDRAEYVGIASANAIEWYGRDTDVDTSVIENERKKAEVFREAYGGRVFESYGEMIASDEIDAIYIPLPPALHYKWAVEAIRHNKHVFLEKPSTTNSYDTQYIIEEAQKKGLAVHENYMFNFHKQIEEIEDIINSGELGDIRLYRIAFGFPKRALNDFRYNKRLGGGALLDCGGYTVKLACRLLGDSAQITTSNLNYTDEFEVDIYGTATMVNEKGQTAQITFGMDNSYKCDLEVWGSRACLTTGRILTAPNGFKPTAVIKSNEGERIIELSPDDTFTKSIIHFCDCVEEASVREKNYKDIIKQAELVDMIKDA